jgi:hypothetical protein
MRIATGDNLELIEVGTGSREENRQNGYWGIVFDLGSGAEVKWIAVNNAPISIISR